MTTEAQEYARGLTQTFAERERDWTNLREALADVALHNATGDIGRWANQQTVYAEARAAEAIETIKIINREMT